MSVIDFLKALSFLTMLGFVLDTQWTFYKMEPSTINKIYQPLIQKPEIDEIYANTHFSADLDINLKNSHILKALEDYYDYHVKSDTMEGFYRNFLKNSLSLTSLNDDSTDPYSKRRTNNLHDVSLNYAQKEEKKQGVQENKDKNQETNYSFLDFVFESLTRHFSSKSLKTATLDLSMLEERFKYIEEDLIKLEQKTEEVKSRQKELYRYLKSEENKTDERRNFVIDQLVEDELGRLDFLEWKLSALQRRLTKTARYLDTKAGNSLN